MATLRGTLNEHELSYVQQVMESLSDGVSSLLLAIIPLQDANAKMPSGLPASGSTVNQLCDNLLSVARELAEEEYEDYPSLKQEILDACNQLEEATKRLSVAIKQLSEASQNTLESSWTMLGDSVKVIAGKTIRLLEIVYNCEVRRLLDATQALIDMANAIDTTKTPTDAVGMSEDASALATKADEVGEYLRDAAKSNQSELISDQLNKAADQIEGLGDKMLNDTNDLLRDRHNQQKQGTAQKDADDIKDTAQGVQSVLNNLELMGDDGGKEWLAPDQRTGPESLEGRGERERSSNFLGDEKSHYDPNDDLIHSTRRAQDALDRLVDRAKDGDRPRTDLAGNQLDRDVRSAADLADRMSKNDDIDSQLANDLHDAAEKLRDYTPDTIGKGQSLADDNKDGAKNQALDDAASRLRDALHALDSIAASNNPESDINATLRKFNQDLDDLKDAAKRGDPVDGADAARRVAAGHSHMKDLGEKEAKRNGDNSQTTQRPKRIHDALSQLDEIVPDTLNKASDAIEKQHNDGAASSSSHPTSGAHLDQLNRSADASKKSMDAAGEHTRPSLACEIFDAVKDTEKALDDIQESAKNQDAPALLPLVTTVKEKKEKIEATAKEIGALCEDDAQMVAVNAVLSEYAEVLPRTMQSMSGLVKSGSDADADQLDRDMKETQDILEKILQVANAQLLKDIKEEKEDLRALEASAHRGDADRAKEKAKDAAKRQNGIQQAAKQVAKRTDDPKQRSRITNTLEELDEMLPRSIDKANALLTAKPGKDKENAKRQLDEAQFRIQSALDELEDAIENKPSRHGHPDAKRGHGANAHHEALEALIPLIIAATEDLSTSPNDTQKQQKLGHHLGGVLKELEHLPVTAMDDVSALSAQEQSDVNALIDDVLDNHDSKAVVDDARNLQGTNTELTEKAKALANRLQPHDENEGPRRKAVEQASDRLAKLLPKEIAAAKKVLSNPESAEAVQGLLVMSNAMQQNAEVIDRAINPPAKGRLNETADRLRKAAERANGAARGGDLEQVHGAHPSLKNAAEAFHRDARDATRHLPQEAKASVVKALAKLEETIPRLCNQTVNVGELPQNVQLLARLDDTMEELSKIIDDVLNDAHGDLYGALAREQQDLDEIDAIVGDPSDAFSPDERKQAAQDVLDRLQNDNAATVAAAKTLAENNDEYVAKNPDAKRKLLEACQALEKLTPQLTKSTLDAVSSSPNDRNKRNKAGSDVAAVEKEIAQIAAAVDPSLANQIALVAKQEELAAVEFRQAAADGDRNKAGATLTELKQAQAQLEPLVGARAQELATLAPVHAKMLNALMEKLKGQIAQKLTPAARDALTKPGDADANTSLDNAVEQVRNTLDAIRKAAEQPPAGKQNAESTLAADDLLHASKGQRRRRDQRGLCELAKTLADHLRGLIQSARADGSLLDSDANRLLDLLEQIEKAAAQDMIGSDPSKIDDLLKQLGTLSSKFNAAKKPPVKPLSDLKLPKPEPKTLDEKIQRVAEEVEEVNQAAKHSGDILGIGSLAQLFAQLAEAARIGDRSKIIIIGRQIHTMIALLAAKLRKLANTCKDKYLKDRLLRLIDPLRNYSTQLKILCSVKAATNKPDADADQQLANVTKSLGNIISESVRTVDTGVRTKRLQKDALLMDQAASSSSAASSSTR